MSHVIAVNRRVPGPGLARVVHATITTSSVGSATGEALVPKTDFQLTRIDQIIPVGKTSVGSYEPQYERATGKMRYFKSGRGTVIDQFDDVPGGIFAALATDQAAAAEGSADVMALSDAEAVTVGNLAHAAGKTLAWAATYTRNLTVTQKANGMGVTFVAANLILTGTDFNDAPLTETKAIQAGAVASGKFRLSVCIKPFKTLTNARLTVAQPTGAQISIGVGTKLALRKGALAASAAGDVKNVRKGSAALAGYVVDTTYNAVDIGADIADGDDFDITYDAAKTEAAAGANVGAVEVVIYGAF